MSEKESQGRKKKAHTGKAKSIPVDFQAEAAKKVDSAPEDFPVVALGASAGGLEALEQFFSRLPEDSGMAYVIIQHLEPTAISSMPEILSQFTRLPVKIVADGLKIEPNCIYMIPSGKNMGIRDGALFLEEPAAASGPASTVDFFFHSLADERGRRSIGIILSGTGTDGTLGLREIKAGKGTILVQDPNSAKYPDMPRSAVETGLVDFILKPEDMPQQLMKIKQTASDDSEQLTIGSPETSESLQQIFAILLARTGHDFSGYKKATILRRLQRRMSINQTHGLADYVRFLENNEKEAGLLQNDLLIGVTAFFRDPEAFEAFKVQLKELIKAKNPGGDLRVWVAGCATGEEAYSVTITIAECLDDLKARLQVQVYGTDIDLEALRLARSGLFPADIVSEVSPERLQRYFVRERNGYRIRKEIREKMVFAVQDFTKDPPFSKMDVICCRNLLIYLENEPQKRLLPLLHYALVPGGILFLGPSETVGESADLFNLLDRKWKIYQRREVAVAPERLKFPTSFTPPLTETPGETARDLTGNKIPELTEKVFLDKYAPTFAVVDEKYRLVYVRGRTGKFLEVGSGQPNWSILEMAREGLKTDLGSALFRAAAEKKKNVREGLRVKTNGDFQTINLTVAPLDEPGIPPGYLMVVFQEVETAGPTGSVGIRSKSSKQTAELEQQLKLVRENLQTTVEELEATNEELKSANEELQSNNEELQSTNEELDTSREELQSLNEELSTTNAELRDKNDLLIKANDDLRNFLDRTDIAIIFLDEDLKIRSFTPASCELFKLRDIDIGRPLDEINSSLAYEGVIRDAREVMRTLQHKKLEVQSKDERWYTMRILPYRTVQNTISGLVLSFLDIDQQKRAVDKLADVNDILQEALEEQNKAEAEKARLLKESTENLDELQTLLDNAPLAIWVARDPGCLTITGNIYANRLFGVQTGDNISRSAGPTDAAVAYKAVCNGRELKPEELPAQMAAARGKPVSPYEMELVFEDGRRLNMLIGAVPLLAADGRVRGAVAFGTDITERKKAEEALKESEARFKSVLDNSRDAIYRTNLLTGRFDYVSPAIESILGYTPAEFAVLDTEASMSLIHPDDLNAVKAGITALEKTGAFEMDYRLRTKNGDYRWISNRLSLVKDGLGRPLYRTGIFRDITERKQAEAEILHLASFPELNPNPIIELDARGTIKYLNPAAEAVFPDLKGLVFKHPLLADLKEIVEKKKTDSIVNDIRIGNSWFEQRLAWAPSTQTYRIYVRDITKRVQAEEGLRRSEARWNAAIESFAEGAIIASEDEQVIYWNPAARAMHGFTRPDEGIEPLEKTPVTFQLWTSDGSHLLELDEWPMRRIKRGETVRNLELRIRRPDQGWEKIFSYSGAMVDTAGGERLIFLTCSDLTELRRAERALRESEEKYRNLFNNMGEEVHFWELVYDEQGQIKTWRLVDANPPTLKTWGRQTVEEIKGKTMDEIFGPGSTDHSMPVVQKVMSEGAPYSYEDYFPNLNKYFKLTTVPLGKYFVTTGSDITGVKQAEISLRRYAAELESANKELEAFSYSVSHDLRSPLRALDGFSEAVLMEYGDKLDETGKDYLHRVRKASQTMSQLIDDILKLSRISRAEMHREGVSISEIAQSILSELKSSQPERRVELSIAPDINVKGDKDLLQIGLRNLLENAWKFTGKCSTTKIEVGIQIKEFERVYFVRDNGVGFDMRYSDKLFQPFQRLHDNKDYPGTGIGLATVQRVIRRHNGRIWAESEIGKGTTFYFTLE